MVDVLTGVAHIWDDADCARGEGDGSVWRKYRVVEEWPVKGVADVILPQGAHHELLGAALAATAAVHWRDGDASSGLGTAAP